MTEQLIFPSKRDFWLSVLLWVSAVACVYAGYAQMASAAGMLFRLAMLLLLVASAVLVLWVLYGTSYRFTDDLLLVRSGPFRFAVPLAEVTSATPSRNPLSSPACSLDRLLIRYGRRKIMVSPQRREAFLRELAARGNGLIVQDVCVVKKGADCRPE